MIEGKLVMAAKIFEISNNVNGISNRNSVPIPAMENIGVGSRVKTARKAKGMAQNALAKAAGMSVGALADLESGKSKSSTKLHRIAAELGIDVAQLDPPNKKRSVSDARALYRDDNRQQLIDSIQENVSTYSRVLRLDPVMIRDGHTVVDNFFTSLGGVFKVDVDPDLLARAYEWAQTHDDSILEAIYVDIEARLSERGVKKNEAAKRELGKGKGARGGRGKQASGLRGL